MNQTVNTGYDSTQANPNQGLPQVNQVSLNQHLGTLYNQDFFVTDTTGRRLSQIPDKSSYPYLLPNGHSVLQLRLPDLLIYLKMDTYLIDVHTGHHYAVYSDCIEKMSILPKLYSTWEYKQLLQTIQNDAMYFGVNRNLTMHYTTRNPNVCKRTSISRLQLNYNTSLKLMTSLDALQNYPDWTYQNTFGVSETCGPPIPGNRILWP